jgi:large subunit ribosomal protein L4
MGSRRSPIWVGGGVVFGPRPRDYSKVIPKKLKRLALRRALTERVKDGDVLTTANFSVADGKTKTFVQTLKGLTDATKVLVLGKFDDLTFRSARNVPTVLLFSATDVNSEQLLNFDKIVVTSEALETLAQRTA